MDVVPFFPRLLKLLSLKEAVFLCQIMAWSKEADKGIYTTAEEVENNLGLSRYDQRKICEKLTSLHLLEVSKVNGSKNHHYKLNQDEVQKLCTECFENETEVLSSPPDLLNSLNISIRYISSIYNNKNKNKNKKPVKFFDRFNETDCVSNGLQIRMTSSGQLEGDISSLESNLLEIIRKVPTNFCFSEDQLKELIKFSIEESRVYLFIHYGPKNVYKNLYQTLFNYISKRYNSENKNMPSDILYLDYLLYTYSKALDLPVESMSIPGNRFTLTRRLDMITQTLSKQLITPQAYVDWFKQEYMKENKVTNCLLAISSMDTFNEFVSKVLSQ